MEACCEPPCARVSFCTSIILEAGLPDPASSCLSSYQPPPPPPTLPPHVCQEASDLEPLRLSNRWCSYRNGQPDLCEQAATWPLEDEPVFFTRYLLGRPFGDQVVPLPCAAIRAAAALPTAIPSFSEILDAASLCETAYARAENDGEQTP